MPQLNTKPWFWLLLAVWIIFLALCPTKVCKHYPVYHPTPVSSKYTKNFSNQQSWPWH